LSLSACGPTAISTLPLHDALPIYETTDDSRNNWFVALITYGEGWHNNHHAYPAMARAGHKWWEIDCTFWAIKGLEKCGLIWDVRSEEHTSELQSREKLVCRLLLEK